MTRIHGVDVSHFQGGIQWPLVAANFKFAFIKATEGITFHDDHFERNRAGAKAAGVASGAYHFFHYDCDWARQATSFVDFVGDLEEGELPPVLDLEQQSYRDGTLGVSLADAQRRTLAWLDAVGNHMGMTPIIYADRDFIKRFLQNKAFAQYPLWLAAYTTTMPPAPAPWDHVTFWQHDDRGSVPGIYSNGTDLDWYNGNKASLTALCVTPDDLAALAKRA